MWNKKEMRQHSIQNNFLLDEDNNPYPCEDVLGWAAGMKEMDLNGRRRLDYTNIGIFSISTVFLGLDHSFSISGDIKEKILFETCIFAERTVCEMFGKIIDGRESEVFDRYRTWEDAKKGHKEIIRFLNKNHAMIVEKLADLPEWKMTYG